MTWIITRKNESGTQLYMDRNKTDGSGEFRNCDDPGMLPLQFGYRFNALHRMYIAQAEEPDWEYEVSEYLR